MAIEADNNRCDFRVPKAYASVFIPYSEDIVVGRALGNTSDLGSAIAVFPLTQQLSFLDIPTQDFFICRDNGPAGSYISGGSCFLLAPDGIRCA